VRFLLWEPLSWSTSGIDEETVPKTAGVNSPPECDSLVLLHFVPLLPYAVPPQMQSISRTRVLNSVLSGESPDAVTILRQ
jgi:hypothetical protein